MVLKIDLDFLNDAKPPKPNYKGNPQPQGWPPPFDTRWGHFETTEQAIIKPPKPNFELSKDLDIFSIALRDPPTCGDAMPMSVRIPPVLPKNATKSGHCDITFQLNAKGDAINIEAESCSEDLFAKSSIEVMQDILRLL